MHLPRTEAEVDVVVLGSSPSTNDELRRRASGGADLLTVVTMDQTAGRGRLGRSWTTPPGRGVAASALIRPRGVDGAVLDQERWGWLPLIAGAAMTESISALVPADLKWPNDVLIDGRKVCGVLAEVVPSEYAVVIGVGVNLTAERGDLPTPTATSLALEGVTERGDGLVDAVLSGWLSALRRYCDAFSAADGDAEASGIRPLVRSLCTTIGRRVDVELPGGRHFTGTAVDIDAAGRLLVRRDADAAIATVAAGDVTHLRYE